MRIPSIACTFSPQELEFKKIGDKFMNNKLVKKHINNPDDWINMKFEQVFGLDMTNFRTVELDPGRLKTFSNELDLLIGHLKKDKGLTGIGKLLFTATAKGRISPEYQQLKDNLIDIQHSFKGRDMTNSMQFQKIIDNLQIQAIAEGFVTEGSVVNTPKRQFNKILNTATNLWNKQMEHSVNEWNKVEGATSDLLSTTREVERFTTKGEGKVFRDFVNVIENVLPKVDVRIQELLNERQQLKDSGKDFSHIRKKYSEADILGDFVPSQNMRNAVIDYLELMSDNFRYLNSGITAYTKSIRAGLEAKGFSKPSMDIIEKQLKERLMPDKEVGYYPHYSPNITAEFMNGLVLKMQRLTELTGPQSNDYAKLDKGKTLEQTIDKALEDTQAYVSSRSKHRKNVPNEYSYLFPVAIQKYTSEVSRFNLMAHTSLRTREALNMIKSRFKEGKNIEGYATDVVNMIQGMHFDMTGQRSIDSPEFSAFLRTALNMEYVSKIGGNVRTAGKNLSQWLVNWVEFGRPMMKSSKKFFEQNPDMEAKVEEILRESGLYYEEAPRELDEGAGFSPTKVKLREDYTLEFKKPSFWEKTADKTSKLAGSKVMSLMMRKVENVNRKSAFKVAFYQTYSMLKNSTEFNNQMTAKGKSAAQIEQMIIAKARRAAITTTTALHYDYSHVSKSEMMKHPVGSIVFQFQHFFNEFTNFNLKKIRGLKNDYMTQQYTGPQAMQAYRLGFAYAMLPGLLSLLFKTDFHNVVEHATYDKVNQFYNIFLGDKEEREKATYGKGMIPGLLGAPLIGDMVTVGQMVTNSELDEDSLADAIFGFGHYGRQSGNQDAYQYIRMLNSQLARFAYRTFPMVTSGHGFMGLQTELGLFPSAEVDDTRDDIMDFVGDLSPDLESSLKQLYREAESHRKKASY